MFINIYNISGLTLIVWFPFDVFNHCSSVILNSIFVSYFTYKSFWKLSLKKPKLWFSFGVFHMVTLRWNVWFFVAISLVRSLRSNVRFITQNTKHVIGKGGAKRADIFLCVSLFDVTCFISIYYNITVFCKH